MRKKRFCAKQQNLQQLHTSEKISYTMNNTNTKSLKSALSVNLNDLFLYKMT